MHLGRKNFIGVMKSRLKTYLGSSRELIHNFTVPKICHMKFIKRSICFFLFILLTTIASFANEGMWLPQLLERLNEKEMKSLGMKISARDIYNINSGSLKDAIVSFGGFCTGEVISSKGLVLTNHHCGFDVIQNNSTIEHNYLRDGFWERNNGEEIPAPDLFVKFIVRFKDVTKHTLNDVKKSMSKSKRQSTKDKNHAELNKQSKKKR